MIHYYSNSNVSGKIGWAMSILYEMANHMYWYLVWNTHFIQFVQLGVLEHSS